MSQNCEPDARHARRVLLLALCATVSMVMGISSIMPMVPMLAKTFEVSLPAASLVITVFTLPGVVFSMISGVLADRFGRRAVLAPSLLLFSLAGAGCSLAPDFNTLLVLRFLQGMGAAPLGALNTTIIADIWTGRNLSKMVGLNMTVLSISGAIYPSLGGLLASLDWRCPFLLPLLALPVAVLAWRTPLANPAGDSTLREYLSGMNRTFHNKKILALMSMTLLTFIMLYGPIITCFPMLADQRFGVGPAAIGGVMIFSSLGTALMASQLGRLSGRFSARNLLLTSQVFYVTSLLMMPHIPALIWFVLPVMLYGMGQGLNVPNVQAQLLQTVPAGQRAAVMAANGMLLRLGQTFAPVTFSTIMVGWGMDWGFYAGLLLALALMVMVMVFLREPKNV